MADKYKEKSGIGIIGVICAIVCFTSIASQSPQFVESGITRIITIPPWIALFAIAAFSVPKVKIGSQFIFPGIVYGLLTVFVAMSLVFTKKYADSAQVYNMYLSLFVMLAGFLVGSQLSERDIGVIYLFYIIAGLIVCYGVFIKYVYGTSLASRGYVYSSKNSVSQILLSGIILIVTYLIGEQKKNTFLTVFYSASALFYLYVMVYLKSRATLICVPVIALSVAFKRKNVNKRAKYIILSVTVIGLLYILLNRELYNTLVYDVFYGGRVEGTLNEISSGRLSDWQAFPQDISKCYLFGRGKTYRESFILSILLIFGVPMGSLLIVWAVYPVFWSYKNASEIENRIMYPLKLIAICYFFNGIFEEQAPFGPGVKCFLLWLLFGIAMARKNMEIDDSKYTSLPKKQF